MSSTHFRRNLIHTCSIERPTEVQSASGELISTFAVIDTLVRCRYVQKQEQIANESISLMMQQVDLLLLKEDVDIDEKDRVSDIAWFVDDTVLDAGPFTVESLLLRSSGAAHHQSVKLERVE